MAEIGWTEEAQRWLDDIYQYIAVDNPQAAARTVEGIYQRTQDLKRFPQLGARYAATTALLTSSRTMATSTSLESSTAHSISHGISSDDT